MHDARAMRVFESREHTVDDAHGFGRIDRTFANDVLEQSSIDILHDDKGDLRLVTARLGDRLFTGVEDTHNCRVRHASSGLRLLPEAGAEGWIRG